VIRLPEGGIYGVLAEHGAGLFSDEYFGDLFKPGRATLHLARKSRARHCLAAPADTGRGVSQEISRAVRQLLVGPAADARVEGFQKVMIATG
jgi:hypothetical protein